MSDVSIPIVQMSGITKRFPGGVAANQDVCLTVMPQTLHAVVGENGAGKSTLMNILFGRYAPDAGSITFKGRPVRINSPKEAIALGIGLVTQHTTLIPALSVLENIALGEEPRKGASLDLQRTEQRVREAASRVGVEVDWHAKAGSLSVASLQKAEIVKALVRSAELLILDEPTALLGPAEAEQLYAMLHGLVHAGATVVFITHKLREVVAHSNHVTVLRGGRSVGEARTSETTPQHLLNLIIGQVGGDVEPAPHARETDTEEAAASVVPASQIGLDGTTQPKTPTAPATILEVDRAAVQGTRLKDASLQVSAGEIVGVAGVDGSGQRELAEAILGLRQLTSGSIRFCGRDVCRMTTAQRLDMGIGWIAEDRHRFAMIDDFSVAENLLLGRHRLHRFGGGAVLNLPVALQTAQQAISRWRIKAPGPSAPAWQLSGGNQQKVVVSRALDSSPRLVVAMQPTRGLDVMASKAVYQGLKQAAAEGAAVLVFSLDLDELLEISHRMVVMLDGSVSGGLTRNEASLDAVGRLMTGAGA